MSERRAVPHGRATRGASCLLALAALLCAPLGAAAQDVPAAGGAAQVEAPAGLPIALTLGIGWGLRRDPCTGCASPENANSFTGHFAVAKPLAGGLGVGLDVSAWRRGHPGPIGADPASADQPSKLVNMLVNTSVTFSYSVKYAYLRGGVGAALGFADVLEDDGSGTEMKAHASGKGIGYTLGGGLTLPIAAPISLVFFANWNVGSYDLSTLTRIVSRRAKHEYVELGMGIALR